MTPKPRMHRTVQRRRYACRFLPVMCGVALARLTPGEALIKATSCDEEMAPIKLRPHRFHEI
jgi:hypothetical protein